jgi:hypothetical protein
LLTLRQTRLVPHLAGARRGRFEVHDGGHIAVHWPLGAGGQLHLVANLAASPSKIVQGCQRAQ